MESVCDLGCVRISLSYFGILWWAWPVICDVTHMWDYV
jgi:hypothetical protein